MPPDHKLPRPRLGHIRSVGPVFHEVAAGKVLWRVHRDRGTHALGWNELRHFGPIRDFRFDPQPAGPPALHPDNGVMYVAEGVPTCIAEVYQRTRRVSLDGDTALSGFIVQTPARFLDLTGSWPLTIGASHAINSSSSKQRTKQWAVALRQCFPDADGLRYLSSLTGEPAYAVFQPAVAHGLFPSDPSFVGRLDDPALRPLLLAATASIGYVLS